MNITEEYPTISVPKHVTAFADVLDGDLVALARYCDRLPGHTPIVSANRMSYLAIVEPDTSLSVLRSAFQGVAGSLPAILTHDLLDFAAQVDPVTALQLQQGDWWGQSPQIALPHVPVEMRVATIAKQLLEASMLLASPELTLLEHGAATEVLGSIAELLEVDRSAPTAVQVAHCFAELEQMLDEAGCPQPCECDRAEIIACLPGIRSIYEEIDSAIMVLDSADDLLDMNWDRLSRQYADSFGRIQFSTARLFPLLVQNDMAVAFAIDRFRLHFGDDVVARVPVSAEQIVRNAALNVLQLYVRELPHSFITADDDETLAARIHDLQNQLLKVQFQYELLTMMHELPRRTTPRLSVERGRPREERMAALRNHMREWLALYQELMTAVAAPQSNPHNSGDGLSSKASTTPLAQH